MLNYLLTLHLAFLTPTPFDTTRPAGCAAEPRMVDRIGKPRPVGPAPSGMGSEDLRLFIQKATEFEQYRYEYANAPALRQRAAEVNNRKQLFVAAGGQVSALTQQWLTLQTRARESVKRFGEACDEHRAWLAAMKAFVATRQAPSQISDAWAYGAEMTRLQKELATRPSNDSADTASHDAKTEIESVSFDLTLFAEQLRSTVIGQTQPDPAFVHFQSYGKPTVDCGPGTGLRAVSDELPAFAARLAQIQPRLEEMTTFLMQLRMRRQMVVEDISAMWLMQLDDLLRSSVQVEAEDLMSSLTSYLDIEKDYREIRTVFGPRYEKARELLDELHCPLQARRIVYAELAHLETVERRLSSASNMDAVKWQLQWIDDQKQKFGHLKATVDSLSRPGKIAFHNSRRVAMLEEWADSPEDGQMSEDCFIWRMIADSDSDDFSDQDDQEIAFLSFYQSCRKAGAR